MRTPLADVGFQGLPHALQAACQRRRLGEQRVTGPWPAGLSGEEPGVAAVSYWPAGTVPSGGRFQEALALPTPRCVRH